MSETFSSGTINQKQTKQINFVLMGMFIFQIIIETTKGGKRDSNYRGDIAVDNVVLKTGACPN